MKSDNSIMSVKPICWFFLGNITFYPMSKQLNNILN